MDMIPQDNTPRKQCTQCQEWKPATSTFFYTYKKASDKLTWYCKDCIRAKQRVRNSQHAKKGEELPDGYKRCFVCKELKQATVENFYAKKSGKYGIDGTCKICHNQRNSSEHFYSKGLEIGESHREMRKAIFRRYHKRHPEVAREQARRRRKERGDALQSYNQLFWKTHPHLRRVYNSKRRALTLQAEGTYTKEDIQEQYKRQKGKCYWCTKKLEKYPNGTHIFHIDHICPLSRGGSNSPDNLVLACPTCNQSKSARLPHEWPEGNRLL